MQYCNTTSDLYRAYPRIEGLKSQKSLVGFEPADGETYYHLGNTGYVEILYVRGIAYTEAATLEALAESEYYYDSDADVLYVKFPDGLDPSKTSIYGGSDWDALKTWAVITGSRDVDSLLDGRFPSPLPEAPNVASGERYDSDIVLTAAKFAVAHLANRNEPMRFGDNANLAGLLYETAVKIINEYNDGKRRFSWEITKDEIGTARISGSEITGQGMIQVKGSYTGEAEAAWSVKIVTAGAVGTSAYQVSDDNGTTYGESITTSHLWVELTSGISIRFFDRGGEFQVNDIWQLWLIPSYYQARGGLVGSANIKMQ